MNSPAHNFGGFALQRPAVESVTIYAAVAKNGVIGRAGTMPWRCRADLAGFRADTMGKPIIMGRRTWDGLRQRPLDGRVNIVITGNEHFSFDGVQRASTLDEALVLAGRSAKDLGSPEIAVIGGGTIYRAALPLTDRMVISQLDVSPAGDTFFPLIDPAIWREVSREPLPRSDGDTASGTRVIYARR